ncbi:hypothetical protein GFY24_11180 [Nocardia sp. SYP-A9097]|uniref:DUF6319 family protein n=1 Tax=Nocardia sp. SYP-A9097 TaxID=2663237 RepID=UPI00129BF79C|nr:DUF6319 family protein [Nocardia sp. SYP-A9097]MRH88001.1 hypothetical protein [Nocardia sp. SYP-A9097]
MSSRSTKPQPLSETEIRQIAEQIDAGRPPSVWFTAAAVGVPEGRSGKVISLGDPSEGDFLQVKPTGSKDVLSFGPTEVTLTKPARQQPAAGAKQKTATRKDSTVTMPSPATIAATPPTAPSTPPAPKPDPAQPATDSTAPAAPSEAAKAAAKPAAGASAARPARNAAAAKKPKDPEVVVTLSGTADGEWTMDVVNGKKRTIKGLSVPGSAVSQAAKILHPEVAEVVDGVLEAVRLTQRAKVEQLQAELENARRLLNELAG